MTTVCFRPLYYGPGVLDAWQQVAAASETTNSEPALIKNAYATFIKCAYGGMTGGQIVGIVDKYINDHPEGWHYRMAGAMFIAMAAACNLPAR